MTTSRYLSIIAACLAAASILLLLADDRPLAGILAILGTIVAACGLCTALDAWACLDWCDDE